MPNQPTPKEIAAIFLMDYLDALELDELEIQQFLADQDFKDFRIDQERDCVRHFNEMIERCKRPVDRYLNTRLIYQQLKPKQEAPPDLDFSMLENFSDG